MAGWWPLRWAFGGRHTVTRGWQGHGWLSPWPHVCPQQGLTAQLWSNSLVPGLPIPTPGPRPLRRASGISPRVHGPPQTWPATDYLLDPQF